MQITITEQNSHEGETFSYIINVTEGVANDIERFCKRVSGKIPAHYRVDRNTEFTRNQVEVLNKQADNGYMNRYDFYDLPKNIDYENETLFYKGGHLTKTF